MCLLPQEATSAQAMNNMSVMGSLIKVEGAKSAYMASPQGAPDPYQALQAQQLAQMQLVRNLSSVLTLYDLWLCHPGTCSDAPNGGSSLFSLVQL